MLFFGYRMYMENRDTIFGLEERKRGVLYASVALIAITLIATSRMWDAGGLGAVLWLAFISARGRGRCTASGAPTASTDAAASTRAAGGAPSRLSRTPTTSTRALRRLRLGLGVEQHLEAA